MPKLDMNDFGAFLGGPLTLSKLYNGKHKTFFFVSYEGSCLPQQQVLVESVPTAALRSGDLSAYSSVIKDPTTGQPFPNNQTRPAALLLWRSPLSNTSTRCRTPARAW